jgi:hypothetical protein
VVWVGAACLLGAGVLVWDLAAAPHAGSPPPASRPSESPAELAGVDRVEEPEEALDLQPAAGDDSASPLDSITHPMRFADVGATPESGVTQPEETSLAADAGSRRLPRFDPDAGVPPETVEPEPLEAERPLMACGLLTCGPGDICCDPSCGICVPEGQTCDPSVCESPVQYPFSTMCGQNTCSAGEVCCNPSCGTCVPDGQSCDPTPCAARIAVPVSMRCGQNTCSVGEVCCNPSCGTCAAEGAACDTTPCEPRIRYHF